MLVCAFGLATPVAATTFSDVKEASESGRAIQQLVDRNIISGYSDGTFRPNESLTRGQAAKMVANILQVKPTNFIEVEFDDVNSRMANYESIMAVAELGIMTGYNDGTFRPGKRITRSQAAKIISEAFRLRSQKGKHPYKDVKNAEASFYVANLYANNVTKSPGKAFHPNQYVTRAHFSLFLSRGEKAQQAFTMYAQKEQYSAFGYTEYDEEIVDVDLDLYRLTLHPLQEGTARLALYSMNEYEEFERHFFLVHVNNVNGTLVVTLEPESIYDFISYATSVYNLHEGLYLKFVPQSFEIYDEEGKSIPEDYYDIVINGEEVEVTMFKDGAFQLYFSNENERSAHAIFSTIENFLLDFSIETISPFIELTSEDLDFEMAKVAIVDYLNYGDQNTPPFTISLNNGRLLISPTHLGEGVIRVIDTKGAKHYIDIIVHEKAGILVVDAVWE